ncbi:MAG: M48 family metallopeptidase [Kiritimatiellales bacterium]|nr:M48 family metallopeptidase [Kiritimatiellales bacterium]
MDFFAQQDTARKKTGLLIFYFCMAVNFTVLLVYFLPLAAYYFYKVESVAPGSQIEFRWWYPDLFVGVCGVTLIVVLLGAIFKIAQLRKGGGESVAVMLGGKQIYPDTQDFFEKRLRNVVEEMAIASGLPVPPVFVMEREKGINAFAAGFTPSDSVVAVTYGTMTGLSRDELQGVIAHEFSHILNNDTSLNITLIGILHGLLIIGITGRLLLEFAGRGTYRRSKESGQVTAFLFAAALVLMIVGFSGVFFGKLIKAAISRSRERLADASAVQFTRNPGGLANALKKIGGLSYGSRIRSAHAEEASHMFFGNGLRSSFFSTHPPVEERVRWLEPTFDGNFPAVTLEDLRQNLARIEGAPKPKKSAKPSVVDLFTDPTKLAVVGAVLGSTGTPPRPKAKNAAALMASIGRPMQQHADTAKQLMDSIPEALKDYARDPFGARALVYLLLLDSKDEIKNRQLNALRTQAAAEVFQALEKLVPMSGTISPVMRLPLIDLSIPALRFLSPSQYAAFRVHIKVLIDADEQVDIFEYALTRVLIRHLDPVFNGQSKKRPANYYALRGLEKETSCILSTLARKGHEHGIQASTAFQAAVGEINAPRAQFDLLPEEECTWEQLDASLDKLAEGSFQLKKWVLAAALVCLMHDKAITVEETELFRAIADSLDCPVPPWVVPVELA